MTTPLRPLSTSELLDTTFSLYRKHFLLFVGIVAVPTALIVPLQLANVLIANRATAFSPSLILLWLLIAVVALVAGAAAQGATFVAVSEIYLGRSITLMGALSRIRGQVGGLVALTFVMAFGIGVGLLLLIVPGVILALMWALAIPVAVLEDQTLSGALSRSGDLTKGFRGRVLLLWILFLVVSWIVAVLFGLPAVMATIVTAFGSGANGVPPVMPGWVLVVNVVSSFISRCLAGPLLSIGLAVLYYDLRVRKEAFDLQVMMEAIDRASSTPGQIPG